MLMYLPYAKDNFNEVLDAMLAEKRSNPGFLNRLKNFIK